MATTAAPTGATALAGTASGPVAQPDFSVRNLWKIFGSRAREIPGDESLSGLSGPEILERTGCVTAVRDVS